LRASAQPNTCLHPKADPAYELPNWQVEAGRDRAHRVRQTRPGRQLRAGKLYREVLSATDRDHLVTNIVGHLKDGVKPEMQQRAIQYWSKVDATLGARIRTALEGNRAAREGDGAATKGSEQLGELSDPRRSADI